MQPTAMIPPRQQSFASQQTSATNTRKIDYFDSGCHAMSLIYSFKLHEEIAMECKGWELEAATDLSSADGETLSSLISKATPSNY